MKTAAISALRCAVWHCMCGGRDITIGSTVPAGKHATLNWYRQVSDGKGYRICRDNGLLTKRRKPKSLTQCDPTAQIAEDLVKRDFTASVPKEKWLTDITEMACKDGKLYLCAVLDCFDGAIVGHSMDDNMKPPLCTAALSSAVLRFGPSANLILHSDRGSQFTSHLYQQTLTAKDFQHSMGRTGSYYDNARMESFFATLKKGAISDLALHHPDVETSILSGC